MNFDLGRMRALMRALKDPQASLPAVHVAGTNGKGSVCAMISGALRRSGLKTATYTSPHLHALNERFVINGRPIEAQQLNRYAAQVRRAASSGLPTPTQFEALTAIAYLWFSDEKVDIAVMETGLGGRLDATNVLEHVAVSVITNIGLDHMAWLGHTEARIAAEKAGIIRLRTPVVTAAQGRAREVILRRARELNAPVSVITQPSSRAVGLTGAHQRWNAAVAEAALQALQRQGFDVSSADIRRGIAEARWPGRYERFTLAAGQNRISVIFDGAHNVPAAESLAATLRGQRIRGVTVLFGALKDKDVFGIARVLSPFAKRILTVTAPSDRAVPAAALAALSPWKRKARPVALKDALHIALREAGKGMILVTGSLYVVAEIRRQLLSDKI